MSKRTLIALTNAQVSAIRWAFKTLAEDGSGMEADHPALRHIENIERQMRGEYTPTERAAIFEEAKRLLKDQSDE